MKLIKTQGEKSHKNKKAFSAVMNTKLNNSPLIRTIVHRLEVLFNTSVKILV